MKQKKKKTTWKDVSELLKKVYIKKEDNITPGQQSLFKNESRNNDKAE